MCWRLRHRQLCRVPPTDLFRNRAVERREDLRDSNCFDTQWSLSRVDGLCGPAFLSRDCEMAKEADIDLILSQPMATPLKHFCIVAQRRVCVRRQPGPRVRKGTLIC